LGAQGRLGEPNRHGQQGGKDEHFKDESNSEPGESSMAAGAQGPVAIRQVHELHATGE
jgi:hypothetical protein